MFFLLIPFADPKLVVKKNAGPLRNAADALKDCTGYWPHRNKQIAEMFALADCTPCGLGHVDQGAPGPVRWRHCPTREHKRPQEAAHKRPRSMGPARFGGGGYGGSSGSGGGGYTQVGGASGSGGGGAASSRTGSAQPPRTRIMDVRAFS